MFTCFILFFFCFVFVFFTFVRSEECKIYTSVFLFSCVNVSSIVINDYPVDLNHSELERKVRPDSNHFFILLLRMFLYIT